MQVRSVSPSDTRALRGDGTRRASASARVLDAPADAATQAMSPVRFTARSGLRNFDSQRNQDASAAQKTLSFVSVAQSRLNTIKQTTSEAVSGSPISDEALEKPLREFIAHWETRPAATAGTLDPQLRLVAPGSSRQVFAVRGLDARTLENAGRETLQFMVRGQASTPLTLEAGVSSAVITRRMDQVLAPLGVRVRLDAAQELRFSTSESDWPSISDSLQIKGEGRLFPTGQFNRLRVDKVPEAIQPETWALDDPLALRNTLKQAIGLGKTLDGVARGAAERLKALQSNDNPAELENARALAAGFSESVGKGDFRSLQAVLPVVTGIHRGRVEALLGEVR